jgi:hypothetical protein
MPFIAELNAVCEECSTPDWDGYGARPVSEKTKEQALRFYRLLASKHEPDIGGDPGGDIDFEWRKGKTIMCIGVGETDALPYAAVMPSGASTCGVGSMDNLDPLRKIIEEILV